MRAPTNDLPLSMTDDIRDALAAGAVVAVGVSGGKDSQAAAIAVSDHLDSIGHAGPRVLIHSDLGLIEWRASLPACEELAAQLGWELIVVKRKAGGLLERWAKRWDDNVARYSRLECIKIISPFSSPSLRFCTSELKTDVIASALRKRFPTQDIISVAGIRAEESVARSRMPVASRHAKLTRRNAQGWSWHPILTATKGQVLAAISARGMVLHPAYTAYGMSRVSCSYCIMSSNADLRAATAADETHEVYRFLCDLELRSSFAFQHRRWLTSYRGELLGENWQARFGRTLAAAAVREESEAKLPPGALYQKGWPVSIPSMEDARIIASVRGAVSDAIGIPANYTDAGEVRDRIAQLYAIKHPAVEAVT